VRFDLKAVDAAQRVIALRLEAANEAIARDLARQQGYAVLSVEGRTLALGALFERRDRFPLVLFSVELLALLEAGLNLVEALQALAEKSPAGETRRVLSKVLGALRQGERFSSALGRFPQHFPALYAATVRSSEQTGDLRESLARFIAYREELDKVRKRIASAAIYPAILLVVGGLVLAFLTLYVVPRFARIYEDISAGLPFFSAVLLAAGRWIEQHGVAAAALALAAALLAGFLLRQAGVRAGLNARLWRLPALGERMRIYQLARFYRTVGMLLRAGVPALRALDMVGDLLAAQLRERLGRARALLAEGKPFSEALTSVGLATPIATRMLAVGERSGAMGEMMDRIARFHDEETERFVEAFVRAFEPILMAVLGLAVGLVVVLMYMPIFELAGSLQ